jgi:hypothetical protein
MQLLVLCLVLVQVREVSQAEHKLAVAVKSSRDQRYGCHWIVTHDGRCMRCYTADTLAEFKQLMGPAYHKLQVGLQLASAADGAGAGSSSTKTWLLQPSTPAHAPSAAVEHHTHNMFN